MLYRSTRGHPDRLDFAGVTMRGLAPDGGLYVPNAWPTLSPDAFAALHGADYPTTAAAVLAPFIGAALTTDEIAALCRDAYAGFAHTAVTPLVQLGPDDWLLELFHGPTLAFKDIALQLLGRLFARFLGADGNARPLTIVGATSGDTGSAAIAAVAGRAGLHIAMLHPEGRVSDVQRRQMTTVHADNVHNIAIAGTFDDAQAMVKRMFVDPAMAGARRLGAVNSINWARLAAQVVYYVHVAVRLGGPDRPVAFSVPTGNFGDVFAGYVAARMGAPIARLIVATNANDIVHRQLSGADGAPAPVTATISPSMDIQVSSNFERLVFDLMDRDPAALARAMADHPGGPPLAPAQRDTARALFRSAAIDEATTRAEMARTLAETGQLLDPHSAVGRAAARVARDGLAPGTPVVTLATAHPAKFGAAVATATGVTPRLPDRLAGLLDGAEAYDRLPNDYAAVRDAIVARTPVA